MEIELRRSLHRLGLRYFVDRPVPGVARVRPDLVFPRLMIAVFVDGCFWHRCPEHGTTPHNNAEWWRSKLSANVERDQRITQTLEERGWQVLRFWEHEATDTMVDVVVAAVASRRSGEPVT